MPTWMGKTRRKNVEALEYHSKH